MAQQLRAQEQEVDLLVFLDTPRPVPLNSLERRRRWLGYWGKRLIRHSRILWGLSFKERPKYLLHIGEAAKNLATRDPLVRQANHRAGRSYVPKPYPGRIVHYLAGEEQVTFSPDPRDGWGEIATEGVETVTLPCRQTDMLQDPYVRDLAEHLTRSLD